MFDFFKKRKKGQARTESDLTRPYFLEEARERQSERFSNVVGLEVKSIGKLRLPSKFIIACDPMMDWESAPFNTEVPAGDYEVTLDIATYKDGDQRIAMARVIFAKGTVARWKRASVEDPSRKGHLLESFCSVDSAVACFMSKEASKIISALYEDKSKDSAGDLFEDFENNYLPTRSWLNKELDRNTGVNIVMFSSGAGDGSYPSYFGYNSQGDLLCLLTDFELFKSGTALW